MNKSIQKYIGKTSELLIREIEEIISIYSSLSHEEIREKLINLANYKVENKQKLSIPV